DVEVVRLRISGIEHLRRDDRVDRLCWKPFREDIAKFKATARELLCAVGNVISNDVDPQIPPAMATGLERFEERPDAAAKVEDRIIRLDFLGMYSMTFGLSVCRSRIRAREADSGGRNAVLVSSAEIFHFALRHQPSMAIRSFDSA